MKESEGGSSASLDTCRLIEESGVTYSMSLLAFCGFYRRKDMVDLLLDEGAGNGNFDIGCFSQQCTLRQQITREQSMYNFTFQCRTVSLTQKMRMFIYLPPPSPPLNKMTCPQCIEYFRDVPHHCITHYLLHCIIQSLPCNCLQFQHTL